ncbi:TetR/AcrR family transcriptional regulator [Pseudonocardia sp. TRM90224]|uniref:TetR/AcrR family transcriptional regulator n=1 Tax=Pseudonocardia sp. TRM90224 TaxID=2812678 RepID=UPI001E59B401|nr:TetR family transcriptional regulator [Pseudonocardia sp. TRM90224]
MERETEEAAVVARAERRRRSDAAIVAAARELFAERGFDRTTIRAVADRAGVDPGLVMQNFGSKDALFAAAARWSAPIEQLVAATRDELPAAALHHVLDAFEDPRERAAALALMRSSLTHEAARVAMRDEVLAPAQERVADTIGGPDAALRAAVLNACMLGVSISRYLLEVPALVDADTADLERILLPALERITEPIR